MDIEIIATKDGSHTLFSPQFDEIYHSRNGALTESQHIFIKSGLGYLDKPEISVFEVGFGTGLNAFLTYRYAEEKKVKIDYHTVELYPVSQALIAQINYPDMLGDRDKFLKLHEAEWDKTIALSPSFSLHKINASISDMKVPISNIDIVFFDAFSPEKQPDMWTTEVFKIMYDLLTPGGILVTYCSKSYVRKNMQQAGLIISKLPGPPGKREMVRATKPL